MSSQNDHLLTSKMRPVPFGAGLALVFEMATKSTSPERVSASAGFAVLPIASLIKNPLPYEGCRKTGACKTRDLDEEHAGALVAQARDVTPEQPHERNEGRDKYRYHQPALGGF